jgi:hypothetical protein
MRVMVHKFGLGMVMVFMAMSGVGFLFSLIR